MKLSTITVAAVLISFLLAGCPDEDEPSAVASVFMRSDDVARIRAERDRAPYSIVLDRLSARCSGSDRQAYSGDYDPAAEIETAADAADCAFIAYLDKDKSAAGAATRALKIIRSDIPDETDGAKAAGVLISGLIAYSWWTSGPGYSEGSANAIASRLGSLADALAESTEPDIAEASALALAGRLLSGASGRNNWRVAGLSALLRFQEGRLTPAPAPDRRADQLLAATVYWLAAAELGLDEITFAYQCGADETGCAGNKKVTIEAPRPEGALHKALIGLRSLRLPDGDLPPINSGVMTPNPTGALAGRLFGDYSLTWDWLNQTTDGAPGLAAGRNISTAALSILALPKLLPETPPAQHSSEYEGSGGGSVLRSDWSPEATALIYSPDHIGYLLYGGGELQSPTPAAVGEIELLQPLVEFDLDPRGDYLKTEISGEAAGAPAACTLTRYILFNRINGFWIIEDAQNGASDQHFPVSIAGRGVAPSDTRTFSAIPTGGVWSDNSTSLSAEVTTPVGLPDFRIESGEDSPAPGLPAKSFTELGYFVPCDGGTAIGRLTVSPDGATIPTTVYSSGADWFRIESGEDRITVRSLAFAEMHFNLVDGYTLADLIIPGESITTDARVVWERPGRRPVAIGMTHWCDPGGCHYKESADEDRQAECYTGACYDP